MAERDHRGDDDAPWHGIEVYCEGCHHHFHVAPSLQGGLANCPHCRRATAVPGGPEPAFWILLTVGILVVLGIAAGFFVAGEVTGGVIALLVGAAVLLIVVLSS